ncbi:[protein-PII] uridylyltransferase [Planctomicrobium sp. SH664]|uniref:[protein-PII] uridylyltransferase n=1 Tax=Planctomicrobium sp. SH664 TaxID=3448125 RepID=UPI003F5AF726
MSAAPPSPIQEIARRKAMVAAVRERARGLFQAGTPGIQIAAAISEATSQLLLKLVDECLSTYDSSTREQLMRSGAIVAIGGTGRGELAPYSDLDLLFLSDDSEDPLFQEFVSGFVQTCWDSGIQLGHATRDIPTCLTLARQDPQIATALIEARHLWGSEKLVDQLTTRFLKTVVNSRRRQFIEDCLEARTEGWSEHRPAAQELEPDVKASSGGLRDLHLIRWIGFARHNVRDIDSLRLVGALSKSDASKLKDAWEFLTRLRIDLHLEARKAQDRLTRDEQLRIAEERGFTGNPQQRPVEQFMQQYFHHSSQLAAVAKRFAMLQLPRSWSSRVSDLLMGHRAEGILYVGLDRITVSKRNLPRICDSVESMLRVYKAAALYNVSLAPEVTDAIQQAVPTVEQVVTPASARLFMDIFRCTRSLGPIVRSMFETGLLDVIIPDVSHVRNLMQFNQYHHFTVDEHTLRAIETVTSYETDDGPIGTAYRALKHKEILHLSIFLHDLGKGFDRDHCIVGHEIALRIGTRLYLPEYQVEQMALLILKHLEMADLAFRRDITDAKLVLDFSREIGSPDTLRMLYVLTAADVTSVGPGTWTNWKAGLLAELFDRCLVILSGKRYSFHEEERVRAVKQKVAGHLGAGSLGPDALDQVDKRLRGFSAYYLTATPAEQIAADLKIIEKLSPTAIEVVPSWSPETGTTEYRIITRNPLAASGCFHKMCGVLAAKRLEILSADINTTTNGVVVDSYRVVDPDYSGQPPQHRFDEVAEAFRDVLQGNVTVESLFVRHGRFGSERVERPVSDLPTRVRIDNESSDGRTIVDVFAHDRPGLLYTVATTLYDLRLSIDMAKIATHFDQVVDVFYVQEADGSKVESLERLGEIKTRLQHALEQFEHSSHLQFVRRK